jgi:hypothetical protein
MEQLSTLPEQLQITSRDWREISVVALPYFNDRPDMMKVVFGRHLKIYTLSRFKTALLKASENSNGRRTIKYRSSIENEDIVVTDEQIQSLLKNIAQIEEEMQRTPAQAQGKHLTLFSQLKRSVSALFR